MPIFRLQLRSRQLSTHVRWGVMMCILGVMSHALDYGTALAAGCARALMLEAVTLSASEIRYGYTPFLPVPGSPRIYLHRQDEDLRIYSETHTYDNGRPAPDWHTTYSHDLGKYMVKDNWQISPMTGVESRSGVQTASAKWRAEYKENGAYVHPPFGPTDYLAVRTDAENNVWDDDNGVLSNWYWRTRWLYNWVVETDTTTVEKRTTIQKHIDGYAVNHSPGGSTWDLNVRTTNIVTLSQPYLMDTFHESAVAELQGEILTAGWNNSGPVARSKSMARFTGSPGSIGEMRAEVTLSKYRVKVCGPKREKAEVRWVTRFVPADGGEVEPLSTNTVNVTFTGNVQYLTAEDGVVLTPLAGRNGWIEVVLDGGNQFACDACAVGDGEIKNECVSLRLGLGHTWSGESAGFLLVHETATGANLLSPQSLRVFANYGVQVIREAGQIRQVVSASALVDVVGAANGYEVRFYGLPQNNFVDGVYVPAGQPFVTWKAESADGGNSLNILRKEGAGASVLKGSFAWQADIGGWKLERPGGTGSELRGEQFDGTYKVETYLLKDAADVVKYKEVRKYRPYPDPMGDTLVELTVGDGAGAKTTTWAYYTDPASGGYGKLQQVVEPGGRWERYEYDQWGRMSKKVSQFLNGLPNSPDSASRVTEFVDVHRMYVRRDLLGHPVIQPFSGRRITESLNGVVYSIRDSFPVEGTLEETLRSAVAGPQLKTVSKTFNVTGFDGTMESVLSPDGTFQLTATPNWQPGQGVSIIALQGVPNADKTDIIEGRKTVTDVGGDGRVSARRTYDIASGLLIGQETYGYDGSGRLTSTSHADGTTSSTTYGCCGVESTTGRDGVTTSYVNDSAGRRIASTRNGITTLYTYDAAGNVIKTERQGRGATPTVMLLNTATYDLGGQQLTSTDALGQVTTFTEGLVRTTTQPDGTTRVESVAQDGSLLKVSGTGVHPVRYEYGIEAGELYTREIRLRADGSDSAEWTTTYTDFAGRTTRVTNPRGVVSSSTYDPLTGQLLTESGAAVRHYYYNALGEVEYTVVPVGLMTRPSTVAFASSDRIMRTLSAYVSGVNGVVRRTETFVWHQPSADVRELASVTETSVDGQVTSHTVAGATSKSITVSGQSRTQIAPDGSQMLTTYAAGKVTSVVSRDGRLNTLSSVSYTYDDHDRLLTVRDDVRGTTTTHTYDVLDRVLTTTSSAGVAGQPDRVTTYEYDTMGRVTKVTLPDSTTVHNTYHPTGELKKTHGSRTYPVQYDYDVQGRLTKMTTWRNHAADNGKAETTWAYDPQTGFMAGKGYEGAPGPTYTYDLWGRVLTRLWARGITTTYGYHVAGELASINYSDGTPQVFMTYNRRGRLERAGTGLTTAPATEVQYAYSTAGLPVEERFTHPGTSPGTVKLTHSYDALLRRSSSAAMVNGVAAGTTSYAYDDASRLKTVTAGNYTANHSYHPESRLLAGIEFKRGGGSKLNTLRGYDRLNRLVATAAIPLNGANFTTQYQYDTAGQRIRVDHADGSYWEYQYDALGQVVSGKKRLASGTPVAGQQFEYAFDDIGNRTSAKNGGNQAGVDLRTFAYTPNALNQYSSRTVPGSVDVLGTAPTTASVTVNGESTIRQGEYFWRDVPVPGSGLRVLSTSIASTLGGTTTTKTGWMVVPPNTETYAYDADGNLTADGHWNYTWDGENRLVRMMARPGSPAQANQRLDFAYDAFGRRVEKKVYDSGGTLTSHRQFVYDGWNVVAVLDGNNAVKQTYSWGADLSGTRQGAGGVGGLLMLTDNQSGTAGTYFYCYDGNGNVTGLVDGNGNVAARYEYGPFGELLRASGPMAFANPFRFSTKFQDEESGFVYYGYRYYNPNTGKWLNTDPIEETGGLNLQGFLDNSPINSCDALGLADWLSKILRLDPEKGKLVLENGKTIVARNYRYVNTTVTLDMLKKNSSVKEQTLIAVENKFGSGVKIQFNKFAQPDFSKYLEASEVVIKEVSGNQAKDSQQAWKELKKLIDTKELESANLIWHHAGNGKMQLIDKNLHTAYAHTGEAAVARAYRPTVAVVIGFLAPMTTELTAADMNRGAPRSCGTYFVAAVIDAGAFAYLPATAIQAAHGLGSGGPSYENVVTYRDHVNARRSGVTYPLPPRPTDRLYLD